MKLNKYFGDLKAEDLGKKYKVIKTVPLDPIKELFTILVGKAELMPQPEFFLNKVGTVDDFMLFSEKYGQKPKGKLKEALDETGKTFFQCLRYDFDTVKDLSYLDRWKKAFPKADAFYEVMDMETVIELQEEVENPLKNYVSDEEILFKTSIEKLNSVYAGKRACIKSVGEHYSAEPLARNYACLIDVPGTIIDFRDIVDISKDIFNSSEELTYLAEKVEEERPGFKANMLYDIEILEKMPNFPNIRRMMEKNPSLKQLGDKFFMAFPPESEIALYEF